MAFLRTGRGLAPILVAALCAAAPLTAQDARVFRLGDRAAVYNLAGAVEVVPGDGREVTVEVRAAGRDAARLRMEQGPAGDYDAVRVLYPEDRIVYPALGRGSRSTLSVRRDGTFGGGGGWPGGSRRVTVAGSGGGLEGWADVRVVVPRGRSVAVHQGVGRVDVRNVDGDLRVRTASASVAAQDTRGALDVDVGSGSVAVRGAEGDLALDTGSGSVRVADVRGRRLHVDTGSGGVSGSGVHVDDLDVDVGSGRVELTGVSARAVRIDTGSGSVRLALARDADSVEIDTGSGGVVLLVPEGFGAELAVDTGSGGIRVDVPIEARRSGRSHLSGRIGDGRGRVQIDTGSGGVRIGRS